MKITIKLSINAKKQKVWDYYTKPVHITKWNFANSNWHCPSAKNDMQIGGKYQARMEAKDKSFGFNFEAIYTKINQGNNFTYVMADQREVNVHFNQDPINSNLTNLIVEFDAEQQNSIEVQREGWQSILNNFKNYVENN
jgi:uncharacterized protein YndB with AHSA1/START domain